MPTKQLLLFNKEGQERPGPHNPRTASITVEDANAAFDQWLIGHVPRLRPSSMKVYRALWETFLRFQESQRVSWEDTTPETIKAFLASLEDSKRPHRERYQSVLERAFEEIELLRKPLNQNPASKIAVAVPKGKEWRDAKDNDPTQFLTRLDQIILREALLKAAAKLKGHTLTPPTRWRLSRDTAIVTTLFACGVKPAELTVLSVNCIYRNEEGALLDTGAYQGLAANERGHRQDPNQDATHAYIGDGLGARRIVTIPEWASEILEQWLAIRALAPSGHASMPIQRLFPGNREVTVHRQSTVMNPATLVRIVRKWGRVHAGLELTPQRLRNTFGAMLLAAGTELGEVDHVMGYAPGAASAFRLRQAWLAWCATHNEHTTA
ncbi:tyrosine-type recombinase/integrase [Bordetella sp. 02P26C-1]|uniref:tyrosine-type recombinase/integrase n=1 Tax=Bordetella sp. 02P26C-1 TaxID=2683195 RepID=UPI0013543E76|nr:hypothetical protein [Bordetella sp. 02P26C-1]MVW77639.1 tyrosine-type recombinase/integrase [Bordetella sp. 02P26C-1]